MGKEKDESGDAGNYTKSDIAMQLGCDLDLPPSVAKSVVNAFMDTVIESLRESGRLELRGFGAFHVHTRKQRVGRNPRTGEDTVVPAKWVVAFRPGRELRARLSELAEKN